MQLPQDIHNTVLSILLSDPRTRNSDATLYMEVIKRINPELLMQPFIFTFTDKTLPKIETVGRARRKCFEEFPELKANKEVEYEREVLEQIYRKYAHT